MLANKAIPDWDVAALLKLMWETWNDVFRNVLGPAERGFVGELRGHRNRWAHQESFSSDDAYRALDSVGRLLASVSAPQSDELEKIKMELQRVRFDEQSRGEQIDAESSTPVSGGPPVDTGTGGGGALPGKEVEPGGVPPEPPAAKQPTRFHGTVDLDSARVGRDASQIADEVITHLCGLIGSQVTVTLEIEAKVPSGAPDNVVRAVTENARTLKFTSQGFESE